MGCGGCERWTTCTDAVWGQGSEGGKAEKGRTGHGEEQLGLGQHGLVLKGHRQRDGHATAAVQREHGVCQAAYRRAAGPPFAAALRTSAPNIPKNTGTSGERGYMTSSTWHQGQGLRHPIAGQTHFATAWTHHRSRLAGKGVLHTHADAAAVHVHHLHVEAVEAQRPGTRLQPVRGRRRSKLFCDAQGKK